MQLARKGDPDLYDVYIARLESSKAHAISKSAKLGRELFFSKEVGCTACHIGPNLIDDKYHNPGIGMAATNPHLGRSVVTNSANNRGVFKTPTIRNVALTAPYMQDGSLKTLTEVVEWYVNVGHANSQLSTQIDAIDLTGRVNTDLVLFLKACAESRPPAGSLFRRSVRKMGHFHPGAPTGTPTQGTVRRYRFGARC